ncbi:MAG TPA: hypothetical protein VF263_02750 [Longimicrobiaceae bacterium]
MRMTAAHRPAPEPVPARVAPKAGEGHGRGPGAASAALAYSAGRGREPLPAFPHARAVERSTGREVRGSAVHDPEACARRGVPAFTDGGTSFFAHREPALRVAAHEAAHVLQHTGATRDAGLGAEGHAGAVSRAVEGGRSARGLLGAGGARVAPAVRDFTEIPLWEQRSDNWGVASPIRVADDGMAAVRPGAGFGSHDFWAAEPLLALSNTTLERNRSVIRLRPGSDTLRGKAPDGSGSRTLVRVEPENVVNSTRGDGMQLWADCERAGRDVMGAGEGTGLNPERMKAAVTAPILVMDMLKYLVTGEEPPRREHSTEASMPKAMRNEILRLWLGGSSKEALERYRAMPADDRDRFDERLGVNRYAAPEVGEGWTSKEGGKGYPGMSTWIYHWAGVVLKTGGDRVTLENYAVPDPKDPYRNDPEAVNDRWMFQMYGPASKQGQTFHEQQEAHHELGDQPFTMRVLQR